MSTISKEIINVKKQGDLTLNQEKQKTKKKSIEQTQMLELTDQDVKVAVINILRT